MRLFLIVVVVYLLFTNYDMDHSSLSQTFEPPLIDLIGENQGAGNFVGIQPTMEPIDYASDSNFLKKLDIYFSRADLAGLFGQQTIVVLPEHLGTWLVAQNERKLVYTSAKVEEAMRAIVIRNFISFLPEYFSSNEEEAAKAALFRLKAEQTADTYTRVMRHLAVTYKVTIVGGSLILPNPRVAGDHLVIEAGPLYNASFVFYPDGRIDPQVTRKVFPVDEEKTMLAAGKLSEYPVYQTAAGKLAVMICADSWYPEAYEAAKAQAASLLAIPSYSAGDGLWSTQWKGYNGAPPPSDVDLADIGAITEKMAWLKYSMGGRAQEAGITAGINVFLRGSLWDMGDDGGTISLKNGGLKVNDTSQRPTITCLWL